MTELADLEALTRLKRQLYKITDAQTPTSITETRPDEYAINWTVLTRREALELFRRFRYPESVCIIRLGRDYRIKPSDLLTPYEERRASQLIESCHPLVWRMTPENRIHRMTLEWWTQIQIRQTLSSRVMCHCRVWMKRDPAWLAERHVAGNADIVVRYDWQPRKFPIGEVLTLPGSVHGIPPQHVVWFPLQEPGLQVRLG